MTEPPADASAGGLAGAAGSDAAALVASPARLAAVHRSGLLDTPAEEAFDALTAMAAVLLRVPASFVSVVDSARDFYKSQVGFPADLAASRALTGPTFCHFTLAGEQPLVIGDTLADPRWRTMPTVTTLGVRAYAGVPLRVDGQTIGSFCVIDSAPRDWTATELQTLTQLGRSAEREILLRLALQEARAQARRAEAAVKARESVVAAVVHDLRSPLHVLRLNLLLLERTASDQQRPATERLRLAIDGMKTMVDDLLAESTVLDAPRTRSPIAVGKLLADVVDTMQVVAVNAGIRLAVGGHDGPGAHAEVTVDYSQMLRVFCNLVGNCLKYCPAGSTVVVSGTVADGQARLQVADDGPGMAADDVAHAFERGWQGAQGLRQGDGAGLGLAIVRALVQQNGGLVQMASTPGAGTVVTVVLPCR